MKNKIEFRIQEDDAKKYLPSNVGCCLGGSVRKIIIDVNDPLLEKIKEIDLKFKKKNDAFFTYWNIKRKYSDAELNSAELIHVIFTSFFEPAGEECGTMYDETTSCPHCGANRKQIGNLYMDLGKIPKTKDVSSSIADEWVVSERFVKIVKENEFTGVVFNEVYHCKKSKRNFKKYFQFDFRSTPVTIDPCTLAGNDPFDLDINNEYRCTDGHVLGLNLISDLYINRKSWDGSDFTVTKEKIGVKRGLLRPSPELLITKRTWEILRKEKINGIRYEIAYLV